MFKAELVELNLDLVSVPQENLNRINNYFHYVSQLVRAV